MIKADINFNGYIICVRLAKASGIFSYGHDLMYSRHASKAEKNLNWLLHKKYTKAKSKTSALKYVQAYIE